MEPLVMKFKDIDINDVPRVGGKNASLGEMYNQLADKKVSIPGGFATTADAFWYFIDENKLRDRLSDLMKQLDTKEYANLKTIGGQARSLILNAKMPEDFTKAIIQEYATLCGNQYFEVAVRSSATAEDLPQASFAGQHESFLNISGEENLLKAVQKCFAAADSSWS